MIRLDYLSCLLTVVSTFMVSRKMWYGLVLAAVNSAVVCVIGVHTAQYGFIPANVFCIGTYAWNIRSWRRDRKLARAEAGAKTAETLARHLPPRTRSGMNTRESRAGMFLAYSASSFARAQRHTATDRSTGQAAEIKVLN